MLYNVLKVCFIVGLLLIVAGIGLLVFTDVTTSMGINGIVLVSLITGLGLLLSIPSKIALSMMFLQKKDEANTPVVSNKN